MKSRLGILLMVTLLVVGVPYAGGVAAAVDFVWDGQGIADPGPGQAWTNQSMWVVGSGFPANSTDNATLADPDPTAICDYSPTSALTINNLKVAGASPTKMTLNVKGKALTVDGVATLADYADLDVDQNLTVADTDLSGNVWVDVADSTTVDLGTTIDVVGSAVSASGISCVLNLQDNTSGTFTGATVTIDADADDVHRGIKLSASGSTFEVTTELVLISDQTAGTKKAKLWLSAGTLDITPASGAGILDVDGGNDTTRRAELDIDDVLTADQTEFAGYVAMDVALNKTTIGGDVVFEAGAIVSKAGPGTFRSGT